MAGSGRFNDGHTARQSEVMLELEHAGLLISDLGGQRIDCWPLDDIECVDEGAVGQSLRLRKRADDGSRLTITDSRLIAQLRQQLPSLTREGPSGKSGRRMLLFALAGVLVVALAFEFLLPRLAGVVAHAVPVSWEEALGEKLRDQFLEVIATLSGREVAICRSPAGDTALEQLVARLVGDFDSPYRFRVVIADVNSVNAFALPGGYVVVLRGLLETAKSPDEVAGVLAHEIGHVVHRHGTEALIRQTGLSLVLSGMFGETGQGLASDLGQALIALSYSRSAEAEADRAALTVLRSAGIRADGLVRFFRRVEDAPGGLQEELGFLSSHPPSGARADLIAQAEVGGDPGMSASDWQALKTICQT